LSVTRAIREGTGITRPALTLRAEVIIMGLNRGTHAEMSSRLPRSTAHEGVRRAVCPILTVGG
jgi:hypothetical protein